MVGIQLGGGVRLDQPGRKLSAAAWSRDAHLPALTDRAIDQQGRTRPIDNKGAEIVFHMLTHVDSRAIYWREYDSPAVCICAMPRGATMTPIFVRRYLGYAAQHRR